MTTARKPGSWFRHVLAVGLALHSYHDAHEHTDRDTNWHFHANVNHHAHGYYDVYEHTHDNTNWHLYVNINSNTYPHLNANWYIYVHLHSNPHSNANSLR